MDVNLQRCEVCKKVNADESKDWVRIGGATNNPRDARLVRLDFCPDCASKTTVKDAVQFQPALPEQPGQRPRLVANPPTVPAS